MHALRLLDYHDLLKRKFVVRDYSTILYYDGTKWNKQNSGINYRLHGIWGNRLDNVHVVGSSQRGRYDRLLDTSPESKPR